MSRRGRQSSTPLRGLFVVFLIFGCLAKSAVLGIPSGPETGCIASGIPNARLVYEEDETKVIEPGDRVSEGVAITYKCDRGYSLQGSQFNLCFNSEWQHNPEPQCTKYCTSKPLHAITYRAECEYNGAPVTCEHRIRPGTLAKIKCQPIYKEPDHNPPDILRCQEDGSWDYAPSSCVPVCGEEHAKAQSFILGGTDTNIIGVPWHVGIFKNRGVYMYHCAGTIISPKVIVSAAHCFWDKTNQSTFDKSLYIIGAGKYQRDYTAIELNAQFRNISSITIPEEYTGDKQNNKGDIAVLVLNKFLQFSPYIAPVCIKWEKAADKAIPSNLYGQIIGWGIDETKTHSINLKTMDMSTTSFADCRVEAGPLASAVANDQFCVLNKHSELGCQSDGGGGFTHKNTFGNTNVYFLWGVVSSGVPRDANCQDYAFTTLTNIQYYQDMIMDAKISNQPR